MTSFYLGVLWVHPGGALHPVLGVTESRGGWDEL